MGTHLVVLQVQLRVRDVLAWTLGHVAAAQLGVVERVAAVLPLCGLRSAQAQGGSVRGERNDEHVCGEEEVKERGSLFAGFLAVLIGVVVGLVLLIERLREHLAEQEQPGVVAQAGCRGQSPAIVEEIDGTH